MTPVSSGSDWVGQMSGRGWYRIQDVCLFYFIYTIAQIFKYRLPPFPSFLSSSAQTYLYQSTHFSHTSEFLSTCFVIYVSKSLPCSFYGTFCIVPPAERALTLSWLPFQTATSDRQTCRCELSEWKYWFSFQVLLLTFT